MRTHVALLRGINVGRTQVAMADLRQVVESCGHGEVATYIQSGNVVFAADPAADPASIAAGIEARVAAELGVRAPVVVFGAAELEAVAARNPFSAVTDPKTLHAVFLPAPPGPAGATAVAAAVERAAAKGSGDDARVLGRVLYLWTPQGFGRSLLRAELERRGAHATPAGAGTARNWSTVRALLSLLGA